MNRQSHPGGKGDTSFFRVNLIGLKWLIRNMQLAIIGAGPVGLFAAFQAGLLGIKSCLIDTLDIVGGQCSSLYPEKAIYDIPACPSISASDLIKRLEEQAKAFKPTFYLGEQVLKITKQDHTDEFILQTSTGNDRRAKAVLIAAGNGAFLPNKPQINGIERYESKSVFYNVKNKNSFKEKNVVIFGGGDAAADWAAELVDVAKTITLVHRRKEFRCMPASLKRLEELSAAGKVNLFLECQLTEIKGHEETGKMEYLTVEDANRHKQNLAADAALFLFGLSINLGPILDWGLDFEKRQIKVDSATMQTNIPGIYAAGDIGSYPGKLKLILTGFSEAALACHSVQEHLNPGKSRGIVHSTSKGALFNEN